jgi:hypothetical protein
MAETLGFLQLCADRRYHRKTMEAFERATGLPPNGYWIEATAGGAPTPEAASVTASFAHEHGATLMGWAAHGDGCGGYPGRSDDEMRAAVEAAAREGAEAFPDARHWVLFGVGGEVEVAELGGGYRVGGGG